MPAAPPVLIVGHGLAGACLQLALEARGQRVVVAHRPGESASRVAAGLVSPVTGPRLALLENTAICLEAAHRLYADAERRLGRRLWHPAPIRRLFAGPAERERWEKRRREPSHAPWLAPADPADTQSGCADPEGSGAILGGGHVDIEPLLDGLLNELRSRDALRPTPDTGASPRVADDHVALDDERFAAVFFCEGTAVVDNPWFHWLPIQPLKGEVLTLPRPAHPPPLPLNRHQWLVPRDAATLRVGATHEQSPRDARPSPGGRERLLDVARAMLGTDAPGPVLEHRAGWRPTLPDRHPVVGPHPRHPRLLILNGFGGRGAFWGPHYAECLAAHWLDGAPLPPVVDPVRYWRADARCD